MIRAANQPRVSVLMSVYNAEQYLAASVESILKQTLRDIEFIIVDDGSTDSSPQMLQRYARLDSRVRLISRPNTGIVGALNDGLELVRGAYVARMDADDLCDARRLALQVTRLERDDELVALGSCATAIDPDGNHLGNAPVPLTHEQIEANHLRGFSTMYHPAVTMKMWALEKAGGYREGFCPAEDLDLWLRMGELGTLANMPEKLFIWRRSSNGIVGRTYEKQIDVVRRILVDTWRRRGLEGEPPEPRRDMLTQTECFRQWAWMALRHGQCGVARHYAWRQLVSEPHKLISWKLAYCAVRGS